MKIDTNSLNLRDLTKDSFYEVCLLSVKPEQVNHVDSNTISIADQCLKNLCINSVAWKKHKARNIYNQYYIDFVNIFNLS